MCHSDDLLIVHHDKEMERVIERTGTVVGSAKALNFPINYLVGSVADNRFSSFCSGLYVIHRAKVDGPSQGKSEQVEPEI